MPREQINYPDLTQKERALMQRHSSNIGFSDTDPAPSEYAPWNESSIHVSWMAADGPGIRHDSAGWVQIGLEVDLNYMKMAADTPNGATDDRTVMWTDTLSAGDIDRMIITLKKAKRKAFPSQK